MYNLVCIARADFTSNDCLIFQAVLIGQRVVLQIAMKTKPFLNQSAYLLSPASEEAETKQQP